MIGTMLGSEVITMNNIGIVLCLLEVCKCKKRKGLYCAHSDRGEVTGSGKQMAGVLIYSGAGEAALKRCCLD